MFRAFLPFPVVLLIAACSNSLDAPPPRFQPNPPYAPQQVDPYVNSDPYAQTQPPVSPAPGAPGYVSPSAPEPSPYNTAPPPQAPAPRSGDYPVAERTTNPGQVKSPYPPYKIIDVSEFKSGQLARDPHNQKIFRVP